MPSDMQDSSTGATFLVLFPLEVEDAEEETVFAAVQRHIKEKAPKAEARSLRDWQQEALPAAVDWGSFAIETVRGRTYGQRDPRFVGFVWAAAGQVGVNEAQILQLALQSGRPVYWYRDGRTDRVRTLLPSPYGFRPIT